MSTWTAWTRAALVVVVSSACNAELDVGDPCVPKVTPCNDDGTRCGFAPDRSYVEVRSPGCDSACLVHKLDNGTGGRVPADPAMMCTPSYTEAGCVTETALEDAAYCSCQCNGPGSRSSYCTCPGGFVCSELPGTGADGDWASYCVRRGT